MPPLTRTDAWTSNIIVAIYEIGDIYYWSWYMYEGSSLEFSWSFYMENVSIILLKVNLPFFSLIANYYLG